MVSKITFSFIALLVIVFLSFSDFSFGQNAASSSQTSTAAINYFKIEVGSGILDCPVLPMRLKEKISVLQGVKDYSVDKKIHSILFNVPEGVTSVEEIKKMAIGCAFPETTINVLMDKKPFPNQ